jgi:hypothetical protein
MTQKLGASYGLVILNQQVLESPHADVIVKAISSKPNALADYEQNLAAKLVEARLWREWGSKDKTHKVRTPTRLPIAQRLDLQGEGPESERDSSAHTKAQSELVVLGRMTGCSVWIASNDRSKKYAGKHLADDCLKNLPGMGLSDEATRRISLIDVIWIVQNAPVCAFEIETSTSIYSGLLRMSDLLAVVPALKIRIYIVSPRERQKKVLAELARPTFQKIGLSDYCRYIPTEDLAELIGRVKGFGGHIQPSILDKVAISLEAEDDQESP